VCSPESPGTYVGERPRFTRGRRPPKVTIPLARKPGSTARIRVEPLSNNPASVDNPFAIVSQEIEKMRQRTRTILVDNTAPTGSLAQPSSGAVRVFHSSQRTEPSGASASHDS